PEECFEYWKAKPHILCKICDKPTSAKPSLCRDHAKALIVTSNGLPKSALQAKYDSKTSGRQKNKLVNLRLTRLGKVKRQISKLKVNKSS
ncbi:16256_t:CDS:2, partial [Gigaspora margarita]